MGNIFTSNFVTVGNKCLYYHAIYLSRYYTFVLDKISFIIYLSKERIQFIAPWTAQSTAWEILSAGPSTPDGMRLRQLHYNDYMMPLTNYFDSSVLMI